MIYFSFMWTHMSGEDETAGVGERGRSGRVGVERRGRWVRGGEGGRDEAIMMEKMEG